MGLAERRMQQEFEKERVPQYVAAIAEFCPKASIAIEIDWTSFDLKAMENMWSVWDQPRYALEEVCKDDLGKQAVADGVKKILFHNVKSNDAVGAELASGTLHVRMNFVDGASGTPGWTAIQKVVEDAL